MTVALSLLCLALAPVCTAEAPRAAGPGVADPRLRVTVNDGWRYAEGDVPGAQEATMDDAAWERVALPHTWNAADAVDKTEGYRRGVGWYRRTLTVGPEMRGRRLALHFEGASQTADVFVNGARAGRHAGGYTAFTVDVTPLVRPGDNVVAVRVDNAPDPDLPPLTADFTFYGGLYRDVWLVATEALHVDLLDHGGPGVYVSTPGASAEAAPVRVTTAVVNDGIAESRTTVRVRVLDADGREVAAATAPADVVAAGARLPVALDLPAIARPRLWSPADPHLYRVVVDVMEGDAVRDRVEQPLGVRWVGVDPDRGFLLNGAPLRLAGTNRHQDAAGLGVALTDDLHVRDLEIVKATGFDFLRLAHYPQDPAVLEAADRLGLVVWEEIPVVNRITTSAAFADAAEAMLVEMIRQHHNHPSVAFWGYMNEVLLQPPSPLPDGYVVAVRALAERLEAVVAREDPSRLTAMALSEGEIDNGSGLQDVTDVFGMNLYFGWYGHTAAELGPFLDALHARHPGRPLLVSEYGAGSDERVHAAAPVAFDFSSEYARQVHRETLPQLLARPWLVGTAVWNQFDFGSDSRQDTKNALNQKGLYFFDRTPKDVAFYYRARLAEAPTLHLEREHTRRAASRPADRRQAVEVTTSLDAVELWRDGVSLGSRRPDNGVAVWEADLHDGPNHFAATGAGLADAVEIALDDRTALFTEAARPGDEVAVNCGGNVSVTDAAGTVWEADRLLEEGAWGALAGDVRRTHHRIIGTDLDPLYQSARSGGYRFRVPDGRYDVTLGFAETEHDAAGARRLTVLANGVPIVTDLDLAGDAGRWQAVERRAVVAVDGGAGLTLDVRADAGAPLVSAIRLRRL